MSVLTVGGYSQIYNCVGWNVYISLCPYLYVWIPWPQQAVAAQLAGRRHVVRLETNQMIRKDCGCEDERTEIPTEALTALKLWAGPAIH